MKSISLAFICFMFLGCSPKLTDEEKNNLLTLAKENGMNSHVDRLDDESTEVAFNIIMSAFDKATNSCVDASFQSKDSFDLASHLIFYIPNFNLRFKEQVNCVGTFIRLNNYKIPPQLVRHAVSTGNLPAVKLFISTGQKYSPSGTEFGLIEYSIYYCHVDMYRLLIDHGYVITSKLWNKSTLNFFTKNQCETIFNEQT